MLGFRPLCSASILTAPAALTVSVAAAARYFDTTNPAHLALLPQAIRAHEELADVAAVAEDEVIEYFSLPAAVAPSGAVVRDRGTAVERHVCLRGYAIDAALAQAALAAALRREIAGVVRWRLAQRARKPLLTSETAGDPMTVKNYRDDAESRWPPGFGAGLRCYRLHADYAGVC